jgi:hypothetical protein
VLRLAAALLAFYLVCAALVYVASADDLSRYLPLGNGLLLDTWCDGRDRWMYDACVVRPA